MTTKPPSTVKQADETSLEKIAYASVSDIPTVEVHDRDRLGYNVWRWLSTKRDSLEEAVHTAGARLLISEAEAAAKIRESLRSRGML
jgi:hypothetical protein